MGCNTPQEKGAGTLSRQYIGHALAQAVTMAESHSPWTWFGQDTQSCVCTCTPTRIDTCTHPDPVTENDLTRALTSTHTTLH